MLKPISLSRLIVACLALALTSLPTGCDSRSSSPSADADTPVVDNSQLPPPPPPPGVAPSGAGQTPATANASDPKIQLKQLALAVHNHGQVLRTFPPAYTTDSSGKPLLSWRVHLLPFLEYGNLYQQFHLDEPWDSEHNKKLVAQMPDIYRNRDSKVASAGKTNFLAVRNPSSVFPGATGTPFSEVADGLSNTIMLVEVSDDKAVEWTKPDDFEYDEANPLAGLLGLRPEGFYVAVADASVRMLKPSISPATLKAMFTRNAGDTVGSGE